MKTHYTKQQGFTLIELMIVVAIIGVLAAIAVPQYQNYVAKSEAASALATITGIRTNVETYVVGEGAFPKDDQLSAVGITNDGKTALGAISLKSGEKGAGEIIFKFNDTGVSPKITTKTLTLERTEEGYWKCETSIDADLQPKACKTKEG
ncbi:pilin [Vibrio metschnikovii]|uniref:Pilin n=1 Tax=Vibrio metschnikovii TaxID=28172 RepID=A0A9X0R8G1_VIBME|nr:pilin [Vibrio metschnikovii]MBC5851578.1 pilin [Vibrio metschnikovii]MDA3139319.1 pilin [Vibrio metschnikovii]